MHSDLKNVHKHMLKLGLGALSHANWHANFYSFDNDQWSELAVLQAAHAAEILIKARIAQEHPLLIFDKIPNLKQVGSDRLDFKSLVQKAKTIQYSEIPDRLWATTGIKLPEIDLYKKFGVLRNAIQHFAVPEDFATQTTDFIYGVIDPFINECWGLYAVDFHEDGGVYENILPVLLENKVKFLMSPKCAEYFSVDDSDFNEDDSYKKLMTKRFEVAHATNVEMKKLRELKL